MSLLPVASKDDWSVIDFPAYETSVNDATDLVSYMKIGIVTYDVYQKCQDQTSQSYEDCIKYIAEPYFLPYYDGIVTVINMYQELYLWTEVVNFGGCFSTYSYCFFTWAFEAN
jgi:hypothetical protein